MLKLKYVIVIIIGFLLIVAGSIILIGGALSSKPEILKIGLALIFFAIIFYIIFIIIALFKYFKRK